MKFQKSDLLSAQETIVSPKEPEARNPIAAFDAYMRGQSHQDSVPADMSGQWTDDATDDDRSAPVVLPLTSKAHPNAD